MRSCTPETSHAFLTNQYPLFCSSLSLSLSLSLFCSIFLCPCPHCPSCCCLHVSVSLISLCLPSHSNSCHNICLKSVSYHCLFLSLCVSVDIAIFFFVSLFFLSLFVSFSLSQNDSYFAHSIPFNLKTTLYVMWHIPACHSVKMINNEVLKTMPNGTNMVSKTASHWKSCRQSQNE